VSIPLIANEEEEMFRRGTRGWLYLAVCGGLVGSCAGHEGDDGGKTDVASAAVTAAATTVGSALPGVDATTFATAKANFIQEEELEDGLGPIMNEKACGNCHNQGATGGAGTQIERRFGTFYDFFGTLIFDPLANDGLGPFPARGGSLRQLMTVGSFTGANGQACTVPLEHEPPEATIHNVGRLTTPLFGLGLVDAMPDSFFTNLASAEPSSVRGIANQVTVLLPDPTDPNQSLHGTRVGRFGWKAQIATLTEFAANAYVNEMGITTQHCIKGTSVTDFSTESQPNGIAQPAGCDDLAPPAPAGVPAGTDDSVGSCANNKTEIQDDVSNFTTFMTDLAPPPRNITDAAGTSRGQTVFGNAGCAGCHTLTTFTTPATTGNGVPGNFAFQPFSDFLVHDMGSLGDLIGNYGDTIPVTRRMRTAPLWGLHLRTLLLHDGRTSDLATAISAHDGQGAAAASAFNNLSSGDKADLMTFLKSL
jgi:CxxC motif-containing protein (DUF1111 family)